MWTLQELNEIDADVRRRDSLQRAHDEEKTGLSLKDPGADVSTTSKKWRRLTYDLCGMHYTSLQFNLCLLQDHLNKLADREMIKELPTYSAPHGQINFLSDSGTVTFDPIAPIDSQTFLKRFGL